MTHVIILTGVPASGGTTVTKHAIKKLEAEGERFEMVTYSDIMLEEALLRNWVAARDDIRKMDPARQKELQIIAAKKIAEMKTELIIIDTHATVRTAKGYLPGLPIWVLDELKPEMIIVVESFEEQILRRRSADKSRMRDVQDVAGVREHQEVNRATCMAYAFYTGATVKILQNKDGKLSDAVEELTNALRWTAS
ncbi:MAG: adenylate kinase [Halobacteriota archaeon]